MDGSRLLRRAGQKWVDDDAFTRGAAIAFYGSVFLVPLLLLGLALLTSLFGDASATLEAQFLRAIEPWLGTRGTKTIERLFRGSFELDLTATTTIVSVLIVIFGATTVVAEVKAAIDNAWNRDELHRGFWRSFAHERLLSGVVLALLAGLMLLAMTGHLALRGLQELLGGTELGNLIAWWLLDLGITFVIVVLFFAVLFKVLAPVRLRWREVGPGAVLTAALFSVGKYAIGFYLVRRNLGSFYGTASSFVFMLLWIYFSAQIMLFGVAFTQIYATRHEPEDPPGAPRTIVQPPEE